MLDIININDWKQNDQFQASGTREKYWVIDPGTGNSYLFKLPRPDTGEAWAEKISSELAKILQYPVADVDLAIRNNRVGSLSLNFRDYAEEFYEGGDLFSSHIEGYNRYELDHYTFGNINDILGQYSLMEKFVFIPVFDALIGNQDRHCDNWGVLRSVNNIRLAPAYDNGSSLGFQLGKGRIEKMLMDLNMFDAYTNRSYSLIGTSYRKKPKYFELLALVNEKYPSQLQECLNRISGIERYHIESIVSDIPEEIMSEIYKEWVIKLLLYRKKWLLDWYKKEGRS